MRTMWLKWLTVCCSVSALANCAIAQSSDIAAVDILPASTVIYIEGRDAETLLKLPLVQSIKSTELFKQMWRSPDGMKLRGGLTVAELALGEPVTDVLTRATIGGWVIAVDAQTEGAVLLAQTKDKQACAELYAKLEAIAAQDAQNNQRQFEKTTYRDVPAYKLGTALVAALDKWLVVTNKPDLGKLLADNLAEPIKRPLGAQERFVQVRQRYTQTSASHLQPILAWTYLDLDQLRSKGVAKELFKRPDDNFAAELLLGGALSVLRHTPTLSASLRAGADNLQLELSAPTPRAVKASDYQFFFGKELSGTAPLPIDLPQPHATLSAYRDVSMLWRHAGDLFGQSVNDQLAQAETTLTTLFSGRDFVEDILGAVEPGLQVVVAEHHNEYGDASSPNIKLPAFALVTQLKDPEKMRPQLKRIFMSFIGFLNIAGAQEQQPQLDIELPVVNREQTLVTAKFVSEADRPKDWTVPVQFNFTPTLLIVNDRAIISSSQHLAEQIVTQLAKPVAAAKESNPRPANSELYIDGELVKEALRANREQLISQNMLEKGHTQEEATAEIELLLKILELFKSFNLRLTVDQHNSHLQLGLDLRSAKSQP